ncbi:MAG: DUF996 domain-containing protein [Candidatus Thermoplasmatota archaeon]|jgi:hypothetical protein|nr:DUF996 domain-containing protein [Candidatus Thermoplasmatota archaeon]
MQYITKCYNLLKKYKICGQLKYESFTDAKKAKKFIEDLNGEVAIKPIGLTGGKGVRVSGDHFKGIKEAIMYVDEVISKKIGGAAKVLIEEKAVGEEFTLQAFSDGHSIMTPDRIMGLLGNLFIALVVLFVFFIVAALFLRKSLDLLAAKTGVKMFGTTGLIFLIGAVLIIIFIGFIFMLVGVILLMISFFSIKTPASTQEMVQNTLENKQI